MTDFKNKYGDGILTSQDFENQIPSLINQKVDLNFYDIQNTEVDEKDLQETNWRTDFWAAYTVAGGNQTLTSLQDALRLDTKYQEGYNPFTDEVFKSQSEEFKTRFGNNFLMSKNPEDTLRFVQRYKDLEFAENIVYNPNIDMNNIAAVAGGLVGAAADPVNVLPVIGMTSKLSNLAKAGTIIGNFAGAQVLRDTLGNRTLEQTSSEMRTNAVMAGMFGMFLSSGLLVNGVWKANNKVLDEWINNTVLNNSASAKGFNDVAPADTKIKMSGNWFSDFLLRNVQMPLMKISPKGRLITSEINSIREAGNKLTSNVFEMEGNKIYDNVLLSSELDTSIYRTKHDSWIDNYNEYRSNGGSLSDVDFNTAIASTIRKSADEGKFTLSDNATILVKKEPHLLDSIKKTVNNHSEIVSDIRTKLTDSGLISGLDENPFYLPFKFKALNVGRDNQAFVKTLARSFKESDIKSDLRILTDDEYLLAAQKLADEVVDKNLIGSTKGVKYNVSGSFKKNRTFTIDRSLFDDFAETDYDILMKKYIRDTVPQIHMQRIFGDIKGDLQLKKVFDEIEILKKKVYDEEGVSYKIIEDVNSIDDLEQSGRFADLSDKGQKRILDLENQFNSFKEDFGGMVNRLYGKRAGGDGSYSVYRAMGDLLKATTNLRLMPNLVLSQVPDLVQVADRLSNTKLAGILEDTAEWAGPKLGRMTKKQKEMLGIYNRVLYEQRLQNLWAATDTSLNAESWLAKKIGRAATNINSYIFTISGAQPMNNITRGMIGEDILDNVIKLGKTYAKKGSLSDDSMRWLSQLDIKPDDLISIVDDWSKTRIHKDGIYWADVDAMTSEASTKLKRAIRREVDNTIIAPDIGNKPLFLDNDFSVFLGQYKGFTLAAIEKYLGRDLQQGGRGLARIALKHIAGAITYMLKESTRKDISEIDLSPKALFVEGFVRGGGYAGIDLISDTLDMTFGFGLSGILQTERSQRRFYNGNSSLLRQAFGPASVVLTDFESAINKVKRGEGDEAALKIIKDYSGFYNAFYTQLILNKLLEKQK